MKFLLTSSVLVILIISLLETKGNGNPVEKRSSENQLSAKDVDSVNPSYAMVDKREVDYDDDDAEDYDDDNEQNYDKKRSADDDDLDDEDYEGEDDDDYEE